MKRNRVLAVVWLIIAVLLLMALVRGLKDGERLLAQSECSEAQQR